MQKATPIAPPVIDEPSYVEVNMTALYATVGTLAVSTVGLAATTVVLWRRSKRNAEYLEALSEYTSRLVNQTKCGRQAYDSLVDEIEDDEATEPETTDLPEDVAVWATDELEDQEEAEEGALCTDCGEPEPLYLGSDLPEGLCSACRLSNKARVVRRARDVRPNVGANAMKETT